MKKQNEAPILIIRKKRAHEAHHGGAWKVAFADFMTAMFALFLVLWLVNQSSDVKSAIAGYFQDPLGRADEYGSSIIPGEGAQTQMVRRVIANADVLAIRRDRLQSVAKEIETKISGSPELGILKDHVEIMLTDEGLRIELIEDEGGFLFEKGSPRPSSEGSRVLELLGRELGALTLPVRIEGHTDAYRYRNDNEYTNWELSADRANAARRIMTASGLRPDQVVQVRAMAAMQPKIQDDPYSPRNRRVTIMMLLQAVDGASAVAEPGETAPTDGDTPR